MEQNYVTEKPLRVPGAQRPVLEKGLARLNLGCGSQTPSGWVNVDGSYNARLARHPFIRRALAWLNLLPEDTLNIRWNSSIFIHDIGSLFRSAMARLPQYTHPMFCWRLCRGAPKGVPRQRN